MPRSFFPLFEVRLLHEYYLTKRNGDTLFNYTNEDDRLEFLVDKLKDNSPSINESLDYIIPESQQAAFSGCQLRLLNTYSGFKVMIAATEKQLEQNITGYEPVNALPQGLSINILLLRKNASLDIISNTRLNKIIPAIYYFTNKGAVGAREYPFLPLGPPQQNTLGSYEQGELVAGPGNTTQVFYLDKSGNEQWLPVDIKGLVTESDRMLLSQRFNYSFDNTAGNSLVSFNLMDANGGLVYTIQQKISGNSQQVLLDFSPVQGLRPFESYTLQVSGDKGSQTVHPVMFADSDLPAGSWGMISLQPFVPDASFCLIDENGLLQMKKQANGDIDPPTRVFEICIKSRYTFWRYRNNKQQKIKKNSSLDPYLDYDAANGILTSLAMRNSTYVPVEFKDGSNSKFIPNPFSYESIQVEKGRLFTDIMVPRSDLFDV